MDGEMQRVVAHNVLYLHDAQMVKYGLKIVIAVRKADTNSNEI